MYMIRNYNKILLNLNFSENKDRNYRTKQHNIDGNS